MIERTRNKKFAILSGDDGLTLPMLSIGADGAISVVANLEPERACAMVGAALDGDFDFARALHHELGPLTRQLFIETNPIPVKAAMEMRGYAPGRLRSPLSELSAEHREELAARLAELDDEPAVETPEAEN